MAAQLLTNILAVFALGAVVVFASARWRISVLLALLLTGMLAGHFKLIGSRAEMEVVADIGVVLLMFIIGVEFSLKNMISSARLALGGGLIQVLILVGFTAVACRLVGLSWNTAVMLGFMAAMSSTVIIMKLLEERGEVASAHGRATLAITVFQDIAVVPMLLLIPIMAGETQGGLAVALSWMALKAVLVIGLMFLGARYVMPPLLYQVARVRSRELFMMALVVICLGVAVFTQYLGMSLALGAFLAGLIVSESEYSQHALSSLQPFRDVFVSLLFISIGMLLDLNFFLAHWPLILALTLLVLVFKILLNILAGIILGMPLADGMRMALGNSNVGEFAFVLAGMGLSKGLLNDQLYQYALAVTFLSLAAMPFIVRGFDLAFRLGTHSRLPEWLRLGYLGVRLAREQAAARAANAGQPEASAEPALSDHLIIVGYGVCGRNLARAAAAAGIPFAVLETNPDTVRQAQARGEPLIYGDASHERELHQAGIMAANVLVITIPDPLACRRVTAMVRHLNPRVHIVARTRFVREVPALVSLGANEAVPEEFETAIRIFSRVLQRYLIPGDLIEHFTQEARAGGYELFQGGAQRHPLALDTPLPALEMQVARLGEDAVACGKTLAQVQFGSAYGVAVVLWRRGSELRSAPPDDLALAAGDLLVLAGTPDKLLDAMGLCAAPK